MSKGLMAYNLKSVIPAGVGGEAGNSDSSLSASVTALACKRALLPYRDTGEPSVVLFNPYVNMLASQHNGALYIA